MDIHQLLPNFEFEDAISNHALALRRLLRSWGHTSRIYVQHTTAKNARECQALAEFQPQHDTLTIYHYSIESAELAARFLNSPGKRMLIYHNVTPPHFFVGYHDNLTQLTRKGREELGKYRDAVQVALGVSSFNCRDLVQAGFRNPRVLPILLDFRKHRAIMPCSRTVRQWQDGWTNFLFVGRISPNKRQDDLIRAFATYNRRIDRRSRLLLVGSYLDMEGYVSHLKRIAREQEVCDHVYLAGTVPFAELLAYYRVADLFLCLSEHEGFCVPLLEAMVHDLPIIAYRSTGIPDTLGKAGVLLLEKDLPVLAELMHLLVADAGLRERVLQGQRARLADFGEERIAALFKGYLDEFMAA